MRERIRREEREIQRELEREHREIERAIEIVEGKEEREERKKREKIVEKTIENLSKNDFKIPKKYIPKKYKKNKKNLAEYIRKLFKEYKWLRTNYFKFLITKNFKNFGDIEYIKLNRDGVVLCYGRGKIVCVYFFFLDQKYFYKIKKYYQIKIQNNLDFIDAIIDDIDDVDDIEIDENINIDYLISFNEMILNKEYLDVMRREIKVKEKRI